MSSNDCMHWLTLRFRDAGHEAGFLKFRTPKLIRNLRYGAVMALVSLAAQFIYYKKWDFSPDQHSTKEHNATMQLVNIMSCVPLCLATAFILFSFFAHRFQPVVVEIIVVFVMGVSMVQFVFSTPHFAGRILKHDTTAYLNAYELTDTEVLLGLDTLITATHILLPVRLRFMFVLQAIGFLSYILPVAFLGTPYPETISRSVAVYGTLIALSGVGLHSLEREQRFSFVSLIHERSLRYQSDFQLAALNGNDRQQKLSEAVQSVTTTTRATSEASTTLFGIAGLMSEALVAQGLREQWLVKEHEVVLSDGVVLGQGGFGVVLGARFFGADVAVKMPKRNLEGHEIRSTLESCCNELRVLRHLRHPNIVSLYGALIQTREVKFALVLELIAGGTFKQFMEGVLEREVLSCLSSELSRVSVLKQIAAALRYLHSREPPVIHGDLKHTNVFVDQRSDHAVHVKLLDFGLSRLVKRSSRPLGGTWRWVAPEVFLQHNELPGSLTATDVFSLGCVMFYASTGQRPFQHITSRRRQFHCSALVDWPVEEADRFLSVVIRDFTEQCTQLNALRRPSVNDVYSNLARIENQFSHQLASQLSAREQPVWTCAGPSSNSQPPPSSESSTDEWALPEASATGGISSCDAQAAGAGRRIPEGDGVLPETVGRLQSA